MHTRGGPAKVSVVASAFMGTMRTSGQALSVAVLGGIDPAGGFGTITGVTLAILILQFLSSGLNMFNQVSNFYRDVIWGGVLILVLVFRPSGLLGERVGDRA